jgi:threonine dehydrogenase-like Zn-dependent dehydrogenase
MNHRVHSWSFPLAVDTPAKIAILGAGPIGLEAALYARFLGYEVEVFEKHRDPWHSGLRSGHTKMLTPFGANCSPLALQAIKVQDETYRPPRDADYLSYDEWHETYCKPLSQTDLIADSIRHSTWVGAVGKVELTKLDCPKGEYDRGGWDFRLYVRNGEREFSVVNADVVLDCSGVTPQTTAGHGGIPVPGEHVLGGESGKVARIWFWSPDVQSNPREVFLGTHTLVVGDSLSAAITISALCTLVDEHTRTEVTWITRHQRSEGSLPLSMLSDDPLSRRAELIRAANSTVASGKVRWLPEQWVERIDRHDDGRLSVYLDGAERMTLEVDRIIVNTGDRPDWHAQRELQLDICPITDAPRPFSEYLLKRPSPYAVEYPAPNPQALITSEPNYYVLGSKSFGRMPGFLYQHGLRQIRDVFTIIGDRADLDLYAQMK